MPQHWSLQQRILILKTYWRTESINEVKNTFQLRFANLPIPSKTAIYKLIKKFDRTGSCADAPRSGRRRSSRTEENVEEVSLFNIENPTISTRKASEQLNIPRTSLRRLLKVDLKLKPYRPTLVQALNEDDADRRNQFCEIFLAQLHDEPLLTEKIIWTDESTFKLNGIVNRHNCVYWADKNPKILMEQHLNEPGVCVWAGISCSGVIGPFFSIIP